ncbi:MAG TPA: hypothetical protein VJ385_05115 [Fibrobacteria bacterium]|nr:hypothetical protein [Fibrobacteria bacterium]
MAITLAAWAHGQVTWQTTHTNNEGGGYNSGNCALASASVRVRVNPAFLDVEEDVEIGLVGGVGIGNDGKSLEIVGNFTLPPGAAVTGALLWDGPRVLQGKLLDRNVADSLYEDLVDRNSAPPPRPRDPLILERIQPGAYRFRIYPVALGFSRHMRLRYQLPPSMGAQGLMIPFKAAVASLFGGSTLQIPVTLENAGNAPKVIFSLGEASRTEMSLPRTRLLTPGELGDGGYSWDMWDNMSVAPGIVIRPVTAIRQAAVKTAFAEGQMAGNYLNLYATVSQEVLKGLNLRSATSLAVVVRNAKKSYALPVPCEGGLAIGCGSVAFNGKSDAAWEDSLQWEAYDAAGKLLASAKIKSTVYESARDTGAAVLWAASDRHFSEKKELPLGPVFGFVDEWASLLSLPGDSVTPVLAAFYNENGVPRIANAAVKDVIPNYAEGQVPNPGGTGTPDPWSNPPITTGLAAKLGKLTDPSAWRVERMQGGFIVRIQGLARGMDAVVEMYDLAGKRAGYWASRSEEGALNLSSAAVRPGFYLLKIRIAGKVSVKRIVL